MEAAGHREDIVKADTGLTMNRLALLIVGSFLATTAAAQEEKPVPVTVDNFVRAESDLTFAKVVKGDGFGTFNHGRELSPLDKQLVARQNRDTLYSTVVFDMDAGDVTITLPDAGKRFMTLITIDEDHYVIEVVYGAGQYTYSRQKAGNRYLFAAIRILVDPADSYATLFAGSPDEQRGESAASESFCHSRDFFLRHCMLAGALRAAAEIRHQLFEPDLPPAVVVEPHVEVFAI
jgi:hypothetical protein